jgi:hypothetical protein
VLKHNIEEHGISYSAYDSGALAVCEAEKHRRCYLEGFSESLVVSDHDTLRYLFMQPSDRLNKRRVRYVRDLQPFAGAMTLACCKDVRNEADPFNGGFLPIGQSPIVLG